MSRPVEKPNGNSGSAALERPAPKPRKRGTPISEDELVILRNQYGPVGALSQVDDFDVEIERLRHNPEFMQFLKQLSQEKAVISLEDLRKELAL